MALKVARSSGRVGSTSVAFLTRVEDSITTLGLHAVRSALVSSVGVVVTSVAFLISFLNAVTTNWSPGVGPGHNSSVEWLNFSVVSPWKSSLEDGELSGREGGWLSEDVPFDVLTARRRSVRTRVGHSWGTDEVSGKGNSGVEGSGTSGAASAEVAGTGGRTARDGGIRVGSASVTNFTVEVINDVITASWELAVGTASIRSISVLKTIVALLSIINDTITTDGESAAEVVGTNLEALFTASVGSVRRVIHTIITLFVSISSSVSAFPMTSGRATITVVGVSIIALLLWVNNTITHSWENAVRSARCSSFVGVGSAKVALFLDILHTITTVCTFAVGSASSGGDVIIVGSIITFLTQSHINGTITTRNGAGG